MCVCARVRVYTVLCFNTHYYNTNVFYLNKVSNSLRYNSMTIIQINVLNITLVLYDLSVVYYSSYNITNGIKKTFWYQYNNGCTCSHVSIGPSLT